MKTKINRWCLLTNHSKFKHSSNRRSLEEMWSLYQMQRNHQKLILFLNMFLHLTFRYAGFFMWCPFGLAIPNPNPTWVSGSSSSGITVEETGTITLSAVPASLLMLYRVGPAATEARRAAKGSRCIFTLSMMSPPTSHCLSL